MPGREPEKSRQTTGKTAENWSTGKSKRKPNMKLTEDVRKYAAEQGMSEEEALTAWKRSRKSGGLREGVSLNGAAQQRRPTTI